MVMEFLKGRACYYVCVKNSRLLPRLFHSSPDFSYYLRLLKKYKQESQVKILAFCLLPDSIHLILHVSSVAEVTSLMEKIQRSYGCYFSVKYMQGCPRSFRHFRVVTIRENFT